MTKKQKKWLLLSTGAIALAGTIIISYKAGKNVGGAVKNQIAELKRRIQELEVENKMLVKDRDKLSNRVQSITYQLGSKVAQYENKSYS